jgi:TonB family protein
VRVIGSIRTATRWLWCSAALLIVAAGCRHTSVYYTPTPGESRLTQDEVRDQSDDYLKIECPRLMGSEKSATGEARVRVYYDKTGAVQKAQILRGTGDSQVDTVWGALVARLKFDAQPGQTDDLKPAILTLGYSCAPNVAITTLLIPE